MEKKVELWRAAINAFELSCFHSINEKGIMKIEIAEPLTER